MGSRDIINSWEYLLILYYRSEEPLALCGIVPANTLKSFLMSSTSFPKDKIRILLLEGIHPEAAEVFRTAGYTIELQEGSISEQELTKRIADIHVLGIRSRTMVTRRVLSRAKKLLTIGCFCIGTDQVDLDAAAQEGVPVFHAPFSNTRSVAELAVAEMVMLSRQASERSAELHSGFWRKTAEGSYEVRNKTVGIIGYGHIGPQVGLLAEAMGMRVVFYDIAPKLPFGTAEPVDSLSALLEQSDFVTLHVPDTEDTRGMIGEGELARMKKGAYLLNLSRGKVVDLEALQKYLEKGHVGGAAVDVFPEEPSTKEGEFDSPLRGVPNVILTPHIGGSTLEAQRNIAREATQSLVQFVDKGTTRGAVNFPEVDLPLVSEEGHRILNIHRNEPGVLSAINKIIAERKVNIEAQYLNTKGSVGYLIMDVDPSLSRTVKDDIDRLPATIRTRLLF